MHGAFLPVEEWKLFFDGWARLLIDVTGVGKAVQKGDSRSRVIDISLAR